VATERLYAEPLFDLLADRTQADVDAIPATGLPPDWERALSAPFVVHDRYGTRCSTVLLVERRGRATMLERRFDAHGLQTGASRWHFDIEARGRRAQSRSAMTPGRAVPRATLGAPIE